MRSFLNKAILGAIALAAISGTAFAQALPPGANLTPVQTGNYDLTGLTAFASNNAIYNGTSGIETITGTLASAVYGNGATPGTSTVLTFFYQLRNDIGSTSAITDFRLSGFAGAAITNSFEDLNGPGFVPPVGTGSFAVPTAAAPENVSLRRTNAITGNNVLYSYDPDNGVSFLLPGQASNILVLEITGGGFSGAGNASVNGQDSVSANSSGIVYTPVPATVVPEANAGLLAGLALPLLGGVAVLRRKKK